MRAKNQAVFSLVEGEWLVKIGDRIIKATWNSRGAALAGLATEVRRLERRRETKVQKEIIA